MPITLSMLIIPPAILPWINHPLSAGFLLLMEMIMIILTAGLASMSFWYSYITFLIMVGGMLVLFMYMTSVASNEKFKFSWNITIMVMMIVLWMITMQMNDYWLQYNKIINTEEMSNTKPLFFSMNKFLNEPSFTLSIMIIIYLLITLIAVIKIININSGPMRHMN
uniref:NADH-ubiquinone oxidoreductase chain 6 n=2 Tax=Scarabaeoidea TaxID=75546 RepID=S4SV16_9SCAR|nr:NADH dehydrogenase subunit 6 [Cheironitis sp. MJTNT-2012]